MKLWEIFRFETVYQLSRLSIWLYFIVGLGLTMLLTSEFVENVRNDEYFLNSPMAVAAIVSFASIFGLLLSAAVSSDAATKDSQVRIEPLLYTSPISKSKYLGGRFIGAFFISILLQNAVIVFLGVLTLIPGIDPTLFGPIKLMGYITAFLLIAVPNTFIVTAILFSVAAMSRLAMASYLMAAMLFFIALFSGEIFAVLLGWWQIGKVLDFTCFTILKELKVTQSPAEVKYGLVGLEPLLLNRLFWLCIASVFLALTHFHFKFKHHVSGNFLARLFKPKPVVFIPSKRVTIDMPNVSLSFNANARFRQTLYLSWHYFLKAISGWGWLIIFAIAILFGMVLAELMEGSLGVPVIPTTGRVAIAMNQLTFKIVVVALIIIAAGKLIWSERDIRISDISDIMPLPDWLQLLSKFLGLTLLIATIQVVLMGTGMNVQAIKGYYNFELDLYLGIFFGLQFIDYLLFAVVAIVVHVLVNQKYVGHMVVFLAFLYTAFAARVGVEHNMLIYGSDPGWAYLEMGGFGDTLTPWMWFKLYWVAWAIVLAVVARLFWVRGREITAEWRIRTAVMRTTPALWKTVTIAFMVLFTLSSFLFYNTNILNNYTSSSKEIARQADYEQLYSKYQDVPQPTLTATSLHVEIYSDTREATIHGTYTLQNKHNIAIDTIHLVTDLDATTQGIRFDRQAKEVLLDEEHGYVMIALSKPLQPGDSVKMHFELLYNSKGFSNSVTDNPVAKQGTYFLKNQGLPVVGYQRNRELHDAVDRIKFDLPERRPVASLYDVTAQQNITGREKIRFEAVIGTSAGQTAVAPGKMHKTWTVKGRNYFHYKADQPIQNIIGILSSDYTIRKSNWNDVEIKLYYHPGHTLNLERIEQSIKASLDNYTRHFGPYQHKQITFVQYPSGSTGATAYAGTVAFTEGFALLNPDADYREIDLPFAVAAHEVAHQWWAHQVVPANVEGAPLLAESLAWYSALGVVEKTYGRAHLQRLLEVMRMSYLTPRSKADVPLLRANDYFQAFRKGPFAMYALREYVGEERVNAALRKMIQKHGSGKPPLPTSLDLYSELQAVTPDSLHYLLTNLFQKNTFWEVETKQVHSEKIGTNTWRVDLDVIARKMQVDTAGVETEILMNDFVEIGVYGARKPGKVSKPLYLQMHRIRSGKQQISVIVSGKPVQAGIDPRNLLIDVVMDDNIKALK